MRRRSQDRECVVFFFVMISLYLLPLSWNLLISTDLQTGQIKACGFIDRSDHEFQSRSWHTVDWSKPISDCANWLRTLGTLC